MAKMPTSIKKAQQQIQSLRMGTRRARQKAGEVTEKLVRTAEIGGTSFGFGFLNGRQGGVELFGVPIELAVGIGANLFAMMGVGRGMETHLASVGDGALAAYFHTLGRGVGKAALTPKTAVSGQNAGRGLGARSQEMQGEGGMGMNSADLEYLANRGVREL